MKAIFSAVKPEITSPDRDHAVTPLKSYVRKEGKDTRAGGEGRGGPCPTGTDWHLKHFLQIECMQAGAREGRAAVDFPERQGQGAGGEGRRAATRAKPAQHYAMQTPQGFRCPRSAARQRKRFSGATRRDANSCKLSPVFVFLFDWTAWTNGRRSVGGHRHRRTAVHTLGPALLVKPAASRQTSLGSAQQPAWR